MRRAGVFRTAPFALEAYIAAPSAPEIPNFVYWVRRQKVDLDTILAT
jgi:hypothetical protein